MAFIERLSNGGARTRDTSAIRAHLTQLLNTARGFGSLRPDYGVGDCVSLLSLGERPGARRLGAERLRADVEETVRRYEPALENVAVELAGRDEAGHALLVLQGETGGSRRRFLLAFDPTTRSMTVTEVA